MTLKVTVCELGNAPDDLTRDWDRLVAHVRAEGTDLVLLPEMAFAPWFATVREFDGDTWQAAVVAHDTWVRRLHELAPAAVLGTRPVNTEAWRHNQGFAWEPGRGYHAVHTKYYLPDEQGFWEASWYDRGDGDFAPFQCGPALIGMQICTEL